MAGIIAALECVSRGDCSIGSSIAIVGIALSIAIVLYAFFRWS